MRAWHQSAMTACRMPSDSPANGAEPAWLAAVREPPRCRVSSNWAAGRDEEAWRFTDLRPLTVHAQGCSGAGRGRSGPASVGRHRPVRPGRIASCVVNGRVRPDLSPIGELPQRRVAWFRSDTIDLRPDLMQTGSKPTPSGRTAVCLAERGAVHRWLRAGVGTRRRADTPVEILYLGGAADRRQSCSRTRSVRRQQRGQRHVETLCRERPGLDQCRDRDRRWRGATYGMSWCRRTGSGAIHFCGRPRATGRMRPHYDGFALITGARLSRQDIQVRLGGRERPRLTSMAPGCCAATRKRRSRRRWTIRPRAARPMNC